MQNEIDPKTQSMLDELTRGTSLDRKKEIAKLLSPFSGIVISVLFERLKDRLNYDIRHNALEVLALSSDPRIILPVIRYIEIEAFLTEHIFDYFRQGLKEQDNDKRQEVNEQFIKYLEEGLRIPTPLEDVAALARNKIPEGHNIIVEVLDTLAEFDGLSNPRMETLLSKYIREYGFDSIACQHALTAISKIDPRLAITHLDDLAASSQSQPDTTVKRVVSREPGGDIAFYEFAICAREPDAKKWKERPYYFRWEQGLVFFLARGEEANKWFVGQASHADDSIQLAKEYLARWIRNIDGSNVKQTRTGKYSRIHVADRYSDCLRQVQQFIDFEKWGFRQTHISQEYESPLERPRIIYDSEWCRVRILFHSYGERHDQSDILGIHYGRLHAADKQETILWQGEPHWCWHNELWALYFLDGMSAETAAKASWNHPFVTGYKASRSGSQPSMEAGMHAAIWERYGQRLFQLFDLRRWDLWDRYRTFIEKVYKAQGFPSHAVPYEKIC